ncbi:hypothetical protein [Chitinimonas sp. BJB300]|uniref:hypothetical protein n=1 Tax=Chitinimonas sp. BJB300 TaxID=1559339 RepID=UPI000C0D5457|nr:hypothetical protein [Chitinimonas sp. BJB300]PHV10103.1 hypothetical protein CSQ89_18010 [Chitinimonas sp. BJB300]TSJ84649.1 hypothetical protein FG002_019205 [Chitinimonas sp. BJB300]
MSEVKKPALPLGGRSREEKLAALSQASAFVEEALEKTGEHSTPWQIIDPKAKVNLLLRMPARVSAKLEYVLNFHPNRKQAKDKTAIILAALEQHLDSMISEIGTPSARRVAEMLASEKE